MQLRGASPFPRAAARHPSLSPAFQGGDEFPIILPHRRAMPEHFPAAFAAAGMIANDEGGSILFSDVEGGTKAVLP